jgi:hypothetical protein
MKMWQETFFFVTRVAYYIRSFERQLFLRKSRKVDMSLLQTRVYIRQVRAQLKFSPEY